MSDVEENHEDEMQQGEGEENAVEEKGVPLTKGTIQEEIWKLYKFQKQSQDVSRG